MNKIDFLNNNNLVPAIIQEEKTGDVLMLGYMNEEAFNKTKKEGIVYFWSRSRGKLWRKGKTSGNTLRVKEILIDCDKDTLLIKAELIGSGVCHTEKKSCFYKLL